MPIPALLAAAPGLIKAGASLFGSGKRKRAEQEAQARFGQQQAALQNFQFENPYANQENVFEDATINQQADQFQAQQADQALAGGLDAIVAGGGGGGDAQAIANAALQSAQGRGANIAAQEQANQSASLSNQAALNAQEAQGAAQLQQQQHGQIQQQFNLAQQDLSQAQAARQQATQDLVGGISGAVGAFTGAHFDPAAVAGRQAKRAAAETPAARLNPLKRLYSPLKQDPERRKYKADRKERQELLERLLEQGGHSVQKIGEGKNRFDQQYTIGGHQVRIDPTTGEFKGTGLAGKRAEEFLAKRGQGLYDQDYNRALEEAGLKSADVEASFEGPTGAHQQAQIAQGTLNPYVASGQGATHSGALAEGQLEPPLERQSPLYRMFKMKWKGMYK